MEFKNNIWPFIDSTSFDDLFRIVRGRKIRHKLWHKDDFIIPQEKSKVCSCGRLSKGFIGLNEKKEIIDLWNLKNPTSWEWVEA